MSLRTSGRVVRLHGLYSYVLTDQGVVTCTMRKSAGRKYRNQKNVLVVGDRVEVVIHGEEGIIEAIEDRRTVLSRLAADTLKRRKFRTAEKNYKEQLLVANVDQLFLVVSAHKPVFSPGFADRVLVTLEHAGIEPILIFNKIDLGVDAVQSAIDLYRGIGYEVLLTSAEAGLGIDGVVAAMHNKVSAFMGQSGVGKTSLLRQIMPEVDSSTQQVSDKTGKGKHTTSFSELYPLKGGGFLADTPGLREFGVVNIDPQDLDGLFPEFREYLGECRFPNCSHRHEPGCAILDACERGAIAASRYTSYERIYEELDLMRTL